MHKAPTVRLLAPPVLAWIAGACQSQFLAMPNGSMEPTIRAGETVQIDREAYSTAPPQRWDLVAFHPPHDPGRTWVLRVVGLPGEHLESTGEALLADGEPLVLPFGWHPLERESQDYRTNQLPFPVDVPEGQYFVLGDNAREANDSRFWGTLPAAHIFGKVVPRLEDDPERYRYRPEPSSSR